MVGLRNKIGVIFLVLLLTLGVNTLPSNAQAPAYAWVKQNALHMGNSFSDWADLTVDAQGNSYVVHWFYDSITVSGISFISEGTSDFALLKYDQAGELLWAKQYGGAGDGAYPKSITTDLDGNIYVTGDFFGSMTLGSTILNSNGSGNMFIAKFDIDGNVLWANHGGSADSGLEGGVAVDNSNNVFVAGFFTGTSSFDNFTVSSAGGKDIYIAKYNSSGAIEWVRRAGGGGDDFGCDVAVDSSGNCYITGRATGLANFGTISLGWQYNGVFVAKYDGSGNALWVNSPASFSNSSSTGESIEVDGNGNTYITGFFSGQLGSMYNNNGQGFVSCQFYIDIFLMKYDASGQRVWLKKAEGVNAEHVSDKCIDSEGNIYITGHTSGPIYFGNYEILSGTLGNGFIAKYNNAGLPIWGKGIGLSGSSNGAGIGIDANNNIFVLGAVSGVGNFDNQIIAPNGSNGKGFLGKLSTITGLFESSTFSIPTSPNPFTTSFQLTLPSSEPGTAILTDILGREVHRQNVIQETQNTAITITPSLNLPAGMYLLQIQQGKEVRQARVLKQ